MRVLSICLLLTGCAMSHEVRNPVEVDWSSIKSEEARFQASLAMAAWNDAAGHTVLWLGDQGVKLVEGAPDGVCICRYPEEHAIRFIMHCATKEAFMHELGHELGLPDDDLPGSIMNPGLWPNVGILPEHIEQLGGE